MASPQKEWRAVPEHQSGRKAMDEELGISDGGYLQQKLHNISRQKDELQQMEIALRAQMIARSDIASMQNNFEAQLKEHADAVSKLQDQLHDKEKVIHDLEKKMEEKDRELFAMKKDNEVAWAKEDLLREQKKDLATFRRELDHSEAERLQHIKQLHDLQEHLQDKERQLREVQDQHRVAEETIIYKDEQLREAQAWIARAQEMDALQSQSLQGELRERTEQCQQLWLGWQRQIIEVERFHLHTIQQLQLQLADARERSGSYTNEQGVQQVTSEPQKDANVSNAVGYNANSGAISNGSSDKSPIVPNINMIDHVAAVPIASSSLLGLAAYIPPGQVTPVHSFILHQQGRQLLPSNLPDAPISYFQPQPVSAFQELQKAQAAFEGLQIAAHSEVPQNSVSSDMQFDYQVAVNGQSHQREYLDGVRIPSSAGEAEVIQSVERSHPISSKPEQSSKHLSSQSHSSSSLDQNQQNNESTEVSSLSLNGHEVEREGLAADKSAVDSSSLFSSGNKETATKSSLGTFLPESITSHGQSSMLNTAKTTEINLLDERSLLACIVRTIPGGGKIHISSTLPNRLGKMLAPLHWHDYKKKYGKLDDFVGNHPELFLIEGDFIKLREGAQEMIAAKAAVAKVAAAVVASSAPHSSNLPSVAVTPLAHTYRPKGTPLTDDKNHQHQNGIPFGNSNVNILSIDNVGSSLDRSSSSSIHINKRTANGRPISGFVGKPLGRSSGSASASRR